MKRLLGLLILVSIPAYSDLEYEMVNSARGGQGIKTDSKIKVTLHKNLMRAELTTQKPPAKTTIIAIPEGFFSCTSLNKSCTKMKGKNQSWSVFDRNFGEAKSKTLQLTMKKTGSKRSQKPFPCEEYAVTRVIEIEVEEDSPQRYTTHEKNCYSKDFFNLFPVEARNQALSSIEKGPESAAMKRQLREEIALGAPVISIRTSSSNIPNDGSNGMRTEMIVTRARKVSASAALFQLPKGYQVLDLEAMQAGAAAMIPTMKGGSKMPKRMPIPAEALEQIKKLKESGQLTPEQAKEIEDRLSPN